MYMKPMQKQGVLYMKPMQKPLCGQFFIYVFEKVFEIFWFPTLNHFCSKLISRIVGSQHQGMIKLYVDQKREGTVFRLSVWLEIVDLKE